MDIEKWLHSLGLQQYAATFRANCIDAEVLPELSEADLEKLGVVLGHRKRLLKAIAASETPRAEACAGCSRVAAGRWRGAPPAHGDVLRFGRFHRTGIAASIPRICAT